MGQEQTMKALPNSVIEEIQLICQRHLEKLPNPAGHERFQTQEEGKNPELFESSTPLLLAAAASEITTVADESAVANDCPAAEALALATQVQISEWLAEVESSAPVSLDTSLEALSPIPRALPGAVQWAKSRPADCTDILDTELRETDLNGGWQCYDQQSQGALNYFNVYLDSLGATAPTVNAESSSLFNLPRGFVGAGMVSTLVVSGLLIGDIVQRSQPKSEPPVNPLNQQKAEHSLPEPTATSPERMAVEPSGKAPTPSKPQSTPPPKAATLTTPSQQLSQQFLSTPILSPPPPRLSLDPLPPLPAIMPKPTQAQPKPQSPKPPGLTTLPSVAVIAPPEALPARPTPRPLAETAAPISTPAAPPSSIEPIPVAPSAPTRADNFNGETHTNPTPVAAGTAESGSTAVAPESMPAPLIGTLQPVTTPQNQSSAARTVAPEAAPTSRSGLPQGIEEYLTLGQNPTPTRPLTLLPLTAQAATEAAAAKQLGAFTVRQVDSQAYQQEWLTSNAESDDPAIASAFPAYGFIDYQRQVIVVLQNQQISLEGQPLPTP
jgi:hypothetical protein